MSEEQPEQPRYVTQDRHRADMAELRLELANSLASLDKRTELIAQDLVAFRREATERFDQMGEQMSALRQDMQTFRTETLQEVQAFRTEIRQDMQTFRTEIRQDMLAFRTETQQDMLTFRQEMHAFRTENRQDMLTFRQEMDRFRNSTTRQLWVLVGVMSSAILGGLIKLIFFP